MSLLATRDIASIYKSKKEEKREPRGKQEEGRLPRHFAAPALWIII